MMALQIDFFLLLFPARFVTGDIDTTNQTTLFREFFTKLDFAAGLVDWFIVVPIVSLSLEILLHPIQRVDSVNGISMNHNKR